MINPHKGFRTPADFVLGATEHPEQVVIDPTAPNMIAPMPKPDAPSPAPAPGQGDAPPAPQADAGSQAAPAAAQAANTPDPAPEAAVTKPKPPRAAKPAAAEPPVHTHRRATDAPPAPPPAPWDAESDTIKSGGFNLRPSMRLHAKIKWVSDNVPKHKSLHEVAIKAVEAYVNEQIAKHYKPELGDQ